MTDDAAPALDRQTILAAFARHHVQFVLVGGVASQAHGAGRLTKDLDLCPAWTDENLDRVAHALRDLDARVKIGEGSIETLEVKIEGRFIRTMEIGPWRTPAGDIDLLLGIPRDSVHKLARYEQLAENATVIQVDGLSIPVASLPDIIRSKEIADRPKDREALLELRLLEARQSGRDIGQEPTPPDSGRGI